MDFEVDRRDFRRTRIVAGENTALSPGQIRLAVERFALTTNNVTYAVVGDMLDYWGFFPTEAPWGRLPAMGLGSVVESAHPDIAAGGRYFGFYPMSSDVVIAVKPLSSTAATQTEGGPVNRMRSPSATSGRIALSTPRPTPTSTTSPPTRCSTRTRPTSTSFCGACS